MMADGRRLLVNGDSLEAATESLGVE